MDDRDVVIAKLSRNLGYNWVKKRIRSLEFVHRENKLTRSIKISSLRNRNLTHAQNSQFPWQRHITPDRSTVILPARLL